MNTSEKIENLKLLLPFAPTSKRDSIIREIEKLETIQKNQNQKNKKAEKAAFQW